MASETSSSGLSLHVTVFIAEENVPKFFEAFLPAYEKVTAEPECTFFEVYQSLENLGELSWVENW
jgi:quinol monooxygenase YgiN